MTQFNFNPAQQNVRDKILDTIRKYDDAKQRKGMILVTAQAGTGKSVSIMAAVQQAVNRGLITKADVCFAYPTNKLRNYFGKKLQEYGYPDSAAVTIYKLLKFYPEVMDEDVTVLTTGVQDTSEQAPPYKIVIVDEAYALPRQIITTIFGLPQTLWILSGDPQQLPPVGEKESYLLTQINKPKALTHNLTLSEVMRQSGSDLAGIVEDIRLQGMLYPVKAERSGLTFKKRCLPRILDGDDVLIMAYTNRIVKDYSRTILAELAIQDEVSPSCHPMFYPGARLTVKNIRAGQRTIVPANETIVVQDFDPHTETCYFLYDDRELQAPIWTEAREAKFRDEVSIDLANNRTQKQAWSSYYKSQSRHIQATSAFVSTIHSSQGLSADHVYINWPSIIGARSDGDQLAYVAASRSVESIGFLW